jgi:hypothetical protein
VTVLAQVLQPQAQRDHRAQGVAVRVDVAGQQDVAGVTDRRDGRTHLIALYRCCHRQNPPPSRPRRPRRFLPHVWFLVAGYLGLLGAEQLEHPDAALDPGVVAERQGRHGPQVEGAPEVPPRKPAAP